jgi:thiol-disulfide isomerase/thioredoxin
MPGNNSNSKSMQTMLTMPKNKNTWAVIGVVVLLLAVVVALYYMRNSNNSEHFSAVNNNNVQRQMSDKLITSTSIKPNLSAANGECVVALFYADWCPHCQHFKPHFKKAMSSLNGKPGKDGKKLRLEMVDCDADKNISRQYDVSGYPTVKLIKDDGTQVEYGGERTYEGLRKYLVSDD